MGIRDLLILIGRHVEPFEAQLDQRPIELLRHVLAFVDHQERRVSDRVLTFHEIPDAAPVDGPVLVLRIRILSRQGLADELSELRTEPPLPSVTRQCVASELAARTVEQMVVDQENMRVTIPGVAQDPDQRQHRLPGPRAADDQMLAVLGQGQSRFLLLAQVLDARQLEPALRHVSLAVPDLPRCRTTPECRRRRP